MPRSIKKDVAVPTDFPERTLTLGKPREWNESVDGPCLGLPVYNSGRDYISCWRSSFWTRVLFLFHGTIWLKMITNGHPPVAIVVRKTYFTPVLAPESDTYEHDN